VEVIENQEFNMIKQFYTTGKKYQGQVAGETRIDIGFQGRSIPMTKKQKKTGLVFFPAFDWAISPTHPEREERLLYTQDQVIEEGLLDADNIVEFKPGLATTEDINRIHICVPDAMHVVTEISSDLGGWRHHGGRQGP